MENKPVNLQALKNDLINSINYHLLYTSSDKIKTKEEITRYIDDYFNRLTEKKNS